MHRLVPDPNRPGRHLHLDPPPELHMLWVPHKARYRFGELHEEGFLLVLSSAPRPARTALVARLGVAGGTIRTQHPVQPSEALLSQARTRLFELLDLPTPEHVDAVLTAAITTGSSGPSISHELHRAHPETLLAVVSSWAGCGDARAGLLDLLTARAPSGVTTFDWLTLLELNVKHAARSFAAKPSRSREQLLSLPGPMAALDPGAAGLLADLSPEAAELAQALLPSWNGTAREAISASQHLS